MKGEENQAERHGSGNCASSLTLSSSFHLGKEEALLPERAALAKGNSIFLSWLAKAIENLDYRFGFNESYLSDAFKDM